MNKLSFSQKNDLVVKQKAKKHFGKDLELFQKHCPSDRLMNELARANEFTFERLDGQMLYELLDKVSIDEILKNRNEKNQNTVIQEINQTPINTGRITAIVTMFIASDIEITEEINKFISENPAVTDDEVNAFIVGIKRTEKAEAIKQKFLEALSGVKEVTLPEEMFYELADKASDEEIEAKILEFKEKDSNPSADEKMKGLEERIQALEESKEFTEDEISELRFELEDKDASIEVMENKIADLEAKAITKKKANLTSSPK